MAPLSVRGRWRWTFLDDGECSVPPTGVWPMPMSSVVSLAVESLSPPPEDHTWWKEVIRSQQSDFTAWGLSPSYGVVLWLPWVVLTVPMATRPLWSAQVREGEGLLVLRMLLERNIPKSREWQETGIKPDISWWNVVLLIVHSFSKSGQEVVRGNNVILSNTIIKYNHRK